METVEQNSAMRTRSITAAAFLAAILIVAGALWYKDLLPFGEPRVLSLEQEIRFPIDFPEEGKALLLENVATLKERLTTSPDDVGAWLDLAIQYRVVGDYEGAVEVWKYLAAKELANATVYHNLGATYHLEFKDYARAEANFRKAIDANPASSLGHIGLHELYRYSYKQDTSAAADALLEGIENVEGPEKINLYTALAAYYAQDKEDKVQAIGYLETARALADEFGERGARNLIDAELSRLRQ